MNTTIASDAHVHDAMFGAESFKIDQGVGPTGVRTVLRFEGRQMVIEKQQDMEPILRHVQAMRERNAGKSWGEGKEVGHIPELFYVPISQDPDRERRKRRLKAFFRQYPDFCAYPAYLKG
jgi:hypothetical protein